MDHKAWRDQRGGSLTEYGIILGLVALTVVVGLRMTGFALRDVLGVASESLVSDAIPIHGTLVDRFVNLDNWEIVRGEWEIDDGQLAQTSSGENQIFSRYSGTDYVIDIKNAHLTDGSGYGVFFRATGIDKVNGYTFQYDPGYGRGAFVMRKWTDGREQSPFARVDMPDFDWNTPHNVKVIAKGNTFTAYVDGQAVLTGQDDTYTEGRVGFRTWHSSNVTFDDLTVVPTQ